MLDGKRLTCNTGRMKPKSLALEMIDRLKSRGITQYRIAKETGLSESYVCLLASGKRIGSSIYTITALKKYCDRVGA